MNWTTKFDHVVHEMRINFGTSSDLIGFVSRTHTHIHKVTLLSSSTAARYTEAPTNRLRVRLRKGLLNSECCPRLRVPIIIKLPTDTLLSKRTQPAVGAHAGIYQLLDSFVLLGFLWAYCIATNYFSYYYALAGSFTATNWRYQIIFA